MRPRAYVSLPGGASHVATIAGAAKALDASYDVLGWSGVSAGALVAVAKAFAIPDDKLRDVLRHWLQHDRILDAGPLALLDGMIGVCHWERIPQIVDELIGEGRRMGDAYADLAIVVTDAQTGAPVYLSKTGTPGVLVREAARATSALVPLACMVPMRSFRSGLYFDGGYTDNTADAVWDDRQEPRIMVRLGERRAPRAVRQGDLRGQAIALVEAATRAEGLAKSSRRDGWILDVEAVGDGLDFSLTETQILTRYATGHDDAARAISRRAVKEKTHGSRI